jgi:hypothetical protein
MPAPLRGWKPLPTTTLGPSSRQRKMTMGPKLPGGQTAAPVAAADMHPERRSGHTRSANPCQPTPMPGPSRGSTTTTTNPAKQPDGVAAAPVADTCMPPKRTPRRAPSPTRWPDEEGGDFEHSVRGHPSIPLLPLSLTMSIGTPTVSIHIQSHLYHSDLLTIIDAPHQYLNIQQFGQLDRNQG